MVLQMVKKSAYATNQLATPSSRPSPGNRIRIDCLSGGERETVEYVEWYYDDPVAVAKGRARFCCNAQWRCGNVVDYVVHSEATGEDICKVAMHPSRKLRMGLSPREAFA